MLVNSLQSVADGSAICRQWEKISSFLLMLREWAYTSSAWGVKSPPSGDLSVLGGCISQCIPPLGSVRIQYWQMEANLS